jgi:hypothetical protein
LRTRVQGRWRRVGQGLADKESGVVLLDLVHLDRRDIPKLDRRVAHAGHERVLLLLLHFAEHLLAASRALLESLRQLVAAALPVVKISGIHDFLPLHLFVH